MMKYTHPYVEDERDLADGRPGDDEGEDHRFDGGGTDVSTCTFPTSAASSRASCRARGAACVPAVVESRRAGRGGSHSYGDHAGRTILRGPLPAIRCSRIWGDRAGGGRDRECTMGEWGSPQIGRASCRE